MVTGRIAQTVVRCPDPGIPAPVVSKTSVRGGRRLYVGHTATGAEPGEGCGGVLFSSMWNWRKSGTVQGTVERVPLTLSHSALRKKMWPGGGDKKMELKLTGHNSPATVALKA